MAVAERTVRVGVSDSVLRWALERSGRPEAIADRFPQLPGWLAGEVQPTLRQLERFAKATSTPLGRLLLAEPIEEQLPIPLFRTAVHEALHIASPELLEVVQTMEQRQTWLREYLIDLGHEPLPFVGSARSDQRPDQLARDMADTLGLAKGWAASQPSWTAALRELQAGIEDAGINLVVNSIVGNNTRRKLNPREFRGFVLVDEYAPLVFVNGADGRAAQMFTLAHELAHVWMGSSAAFDLRALLPADDPTERACDQAAAEFLVPAAQLRELWPSVRQIPDRFQAMARQFKVSEIVVARRSLDLDLIARQDFFDFYSNYQKRDRTTTKGREGGDFYAMQSLRLGRRFAESVVRAAREGKLLYRDAYRLTGLQGATFERYAKRALGEAS